VLLVILAAACGSDKATPDAMPDAPPRCDPSVPFAAPVPVDGLNTMLDEVSARLSPDELTVVFTRRQTTLVYDLYQATRPSRDATFSSIELLATVNSVNSEVWPSLSLDGLTLAFDSDRGTPNMYRIYIARRASTSERFASATLIPELMVREVHPSLVNDHALYFTSPVRTGQGLEDIWRAELNPDGSLGTPASVLGGVNSPAEEVAATLTEDELRIYFRRTVAAEPDIYTASRSTVNDGFGAATPVPGLSVAGVSEDPTWVSADGCNLYLFSDAPGGAGGQDLYVARRGEP
jgi:hypothetical protein